ncbi:MAG TPA: FAD-dependent oxidoreductase [Planctomycetota bacterium]|nr:FAD-dependent oxidoreductase [Planctomycetota bacterium]
MREANLTRRQLLRAGAAAGGGVLLAAARGAEPTPPAKAETGKKPPREPRMYTEPAKRVPMLGEYDVIVCGGGPAGCAAAVAAARHGARTLLVERDGYLGGTTVSALVVPILSTNGVDFQGVWHELMRALQRRSGVSGLTRGHPVAAHWIVGSVDPEQVKHAWDELVTGAGATLLHHALVAGAIVDAGRCRGVVVETRAGRRALCAQRVVDCTGDGAVCAHAGVPSEQGIDGQKWAMGVGFMWRLAGVPAVASTTQGQGVPGFGRTVGARPECLGGMLRLLRVDPLDPWDLTRAVREGRREALRLAQAARKKPGLEQAYLVDTAAQPGIRQSRRVHGLATATRDDAMQFRKHADGVARSSWEIDIHSATDPRKKGVAYDDPAYRPRIEGAKRGDYFDVRYGCLVAKGVDDLLVAGRCLSAEHEAQASLRIQQTCMATGQAAGTAAALSLKEGVAPRQLDPAKLVAQLDKDRAVEPAFEILKNLPIAPRS